MINLELIGQNWPDILRVVGSLSTESIRASEILLARQAPSGAALPTGQSVEFLAGVAERLLTQHGAA